jgi:N-acetylglutamate synthase-like GNAT family acetyltransferase
MMIRRFQNQDAEAISKLICRNFREVNVNDYTKQEMEELSLTYNADKILKIASYAHMYVACAGKNIIGCGAISSYWGSETESILLTIFVMPEQHKIGIGRKIIETLEQDEFFLRAERIEIPASITACGFYEKMGYGYKSGRKELDNQGHYRMEKIQKIN